MANEFVIKNGYFSQGNSNVTGSLQVSGSVGVTGSVSITQNLTASKALFSSSGNNQLMVMGSGSSSWLTGIYGSQGNLFTVTDTFSGSIFTVSDISGYPILDVISNTSTGDSVQVIGTSSLSGSLFVNQNGNTPFQIDNNLINFYVTESKYWEVADRATTDRLFRMKYDALAPVPGVVVDIGGISSTDTVLTVDQTLQTININAQTASISNLTDVAQTNVVTIDTNTGQLFYTASSAFGGGGGGNFVPSAWTGSSTSQFSGTASLANTASYFKGPGGATISDDGSDNLTIDAGRIFVTASNLIEIGAVNSTTIKGNFILSDLINNPTPAYTNVLTYDPGSKLVAYTASSAIGGGYKSTSSLVGGSGTSYNIDHNFGTNNLHVTVYSSSAPFETVYPDIQRPNTNRVTVLFNNAPAAGEFTVYISQ